MSSKTQLDSHQSMKMKLSKPQVHFIPDKADDKPATPSFLKECEKMSIQD